MQKKSVSKKRLSHATTLGWHDPKFPEKLRVARNRCRTLLGDELMNRYADSEDVDSFMAFDGVREQLGCIFGTKHGYTNDLTGLGVAVLQRDREEREAARREERLRFAEATRRRTKGQKPPFVNRKVA